MKFIKNGFKIIYKKYKLLVKLIIKKILNSASNTKIGCYLIGQISDIALSQVTSVIHNRVDLTFSTPNELCRWRCKTFSEKEPETLEWIDSFETGAIFWDIGANIGLYSLYAARHRDCQVVAFEPSIFNTELLAKNINLNMLQNKISIAPIAISNRCGMNKFIFSTTELGGALSTFGETYGWDGNEITEKFSVITAGMTLDDISTILKLSNPRYIKIDVDGIEHLVLSGGLNILRNVESVLIEVTLNFKEQTEGCSRILRESGLRLRETRQSDLIANSSHGFNNSYNQIWVRRD